MSFLSFLFWLPENFLKKGWKKNHNLAVSFQKEGLSSLRTWRWLLIVKYYQVPGCPSTVPTSPVILREYTYWIRFVYRSSMIFVTSFGVFLWNCGSQNKPTKIMENCGLGKTKRYNKRMDGPYFSIFLKYEILFFFWVGIIFYPPIPYQSDIAQGRIEVSKDHTFATSLPSDHKIHLWYCWCFRNP